MRDPESKFSMPEVFNGDNSAIEWRAACHPSNGECVEAGRLPGSDEYQIGFRDSEDPKGPRLAFSQKAVESFFADSKAGRYDDIDSLPHFTPSEEPAEALQPAV